MAAVRYFGGLDLIRLFAALMVFVFHVGWLSWAAPGSMMHTLSGGTVEMPFFSQYGWIGRFGVEIFFVVSGFVIAQSAASATAYGFLRSRAARLLPAFWICVTLTLIALLLLGQTHWKWLLYLYARSLLMLLPWPYLDTVYWTLAVEIVFYVLILALIAANKFQHLELFAAGLAAYSLIYSLLRLNGLPEWSPLLLAENGAQFALGIALWLLASKGATTARWIIMAISLAGSLLSIHVVCRVMNMNGGAAWQAEVVWLAAVGLIALSATCRFKGNQLTRTLGLMTYPVYLLHNDIGCILLRSHEYIGKQGAIVLAFAGPLALAYIVVKIEPALRLLLTNTLDSTALKLGFSIARARPEGATI